MPLIYIDYEKIGNKKVLTIEYTGFEEGFIESILSKRNIHYEKEGRTIIIENAGKKQVKKILIENGVDARYIVTPGEVFSFKYILESLSMKRSTKRVCPRCGSTNVRKVSFLSGWFTPLQFICENCGYVGVAFLEVEE
ncbi:MAG: hypothetical protein DRJ38_08945 [Thermoprotei archaeon]|nr:MAG: hypothetical protein DRJ38_08945 [Thermoprotei archaeon]